MSADAYPASAPQQPHNESRHVAQNMSLIYPNLSRPTFSEKDPDRSDFGLSVEDSDIEEEDEIDAYGTNKDELFDAPRCTGVIEWFNCLFFDVILLLLETALAIWLARSLYPHEMITEYRTILVLLAIPALINPFIWLRMKSSGSTPHYKRIGTVFIFVLLLSSLNSPFLVYLWHLYQSALGSRRSAFNSKLLANTFRMVQATFTSVPLLVLNVATLASVLRAEDDDNVIDIRLLSAHLGEVKMHGLAFFISMINLLRAASLFNERLTFTVMFGIIALPFLMLTVISRLMSVAIIVAFLDFQWTTLMFAALFFCNVLFYVLCRKRSKVISKDSVLQPVGHRKGTSSATSNTHSSSTTEDDLIETAESYSEDSSQGCLSGMCCNSTSSGKRCCQDKGVSSPNRASLNTSHRSGKYNIATGTYYTTSRTKSKTSQSKQNATPESCWSDLPKMIALSIGSILVPVGYTNDVRQHHPRIKGGLFLLLNYVAHMVIIGLALGYTIRHKVPNTIKGVSISNPSIEVQIPDSKIFIGAAGMDVALNMPKTKMNLGSMPAMTATLNTEASDVMHAIILPVMFAVFCLPFVIMRAAMMELDCFITHKKELDSLEDVKLADSRHRRKHKNRNSDTLLETVLRNSENKTLKTRMYVSLCCGVFGMMIFTTFTMMAGAFIFFSLH